MTNTHELSKHFSDLNSIDIFLLLAKVKEVCELKHKEIGVLMEGLREKDGAHF